MSFSTKLKKNHKNVHSYYTKVYILVSVDYQIVIGVVLTC